MLLVAPSTDAVDQQFLERYAELAVHVGANVQPGQPVVVTGSIGHADLVRAVARAAWQTGAGDVELHYTDPFERYLLARYAPDGALERSAVGELALLESFLTRDAALIRISGELAPSFLEGLDETRLGRVLARRLQEVTMRLITERRAAWTLIVYPDRGWSERIFGTADVPRLVALLTRVCRLDRDDPVAAWRGRLEELRRRAASLTERRFTSLRVRGPAQT